MNQEGSFRNLAKIKGKSIIFLIVLRYRLPYHEAQTTREQLPITISGFNK